MISVQRVFKRDSYDWRERSLDQQNSLRLSRPRPRWAGLIWSAHSTEE